eukprot:10588367-Alexandrium_andersonii.AAC.1
MSASLVGSEMCIRDRCLCPVLCLVLRPLPRPGLRPSSAFFCPLLRPAAVSYTHLTLPTICSV